MMKRLIQLVLLLAALPFAHGQTSAVTAQITDADGITWVNGSCTATLIYKPQIPAVAPYLIGGGNVPLNPTCTVNGSGVLGVTVTDVRFIDPRFSPTWQFTVCPNVSQQSGPAACGITVKSITGATANLTGQLNLPVPRIGGGVGAFAYADVEVAALYNNFYWNILSNTCRQWQLTWGVCNNGGGGGGSGTVNNGNLGQLADYPANGTTVQGAQNLYVVNPTWTQAQVNTLFSGLSGTNSVIIPAGTPQALYATNGQIPWDARLGASYFQMPGVACDGRQSALTIAITSGLNTSNVGALLTAADIGKTFFFFKRTGYGFSDTQNVWTATLTAYSFPTATWSANAPFTANSQVFYGTDNLSTINTAMGQASAVFPLTIPTGCKLLVNGTIQWNNNQVIVSRHQHQAGFIGPPGQDVISTVDAPGNSVSSAGTGLKGFSITVGTEIDATLGYNKYAADGTLTVVPPLYRPGYPHSSVANHPCGPGWVVGCRNGVSSTTQGSAVICTVNSITPPAVGTNIVFPYGPKVFTTTVASTAGSGSCPGGTTARTMAVAMPNVSGYTVAQNEWFSGTSIQATSTAIPGTPTYPFTIQLTNSTKPVPGWPSNFAQHGHAKIQDYEFDYLGVDYINNTMVIRKGPATVNGGAGYSGTNTIVPLNPCPAKFGTPWPVTPTLNAGDSTPSGANWFPGECFGNAGIAFPQANGNTYAGTGLSGGYISDIDFIGSAGPGTNSDNANNVADIVTQGNNASFSSHFENIISSNIQYGIVQGPASYGMHGVAAVGPTGIGNTYHNLWLFAAMPLSFVDLQSTDFTDLNMNSAERSPYDGTAIGSSICIHEGFTLDEQTGGVVTSTQYNSHRGYACEGENGSHAEVISAADLEGSHLSFDTANFENPPNVFGGDHFKCSNCRISRPSIDYGTNNDFGTIDVGGVAYNTNVWDGRPQMFLWGRNATCSMYAAGGGPPIKCGASTVQPYQGRGIEASVTGNKGYDALGGTITPWMWDNNGAFDTNPFTKSGTSDPTAPYWGASAQCALGGSLLCHTNHFSQAVDGFVYIGPFDQLYDGPYVLDAAFKSLSAPSSFTLIIRANDSGTGQCASGPVTTIFSGPVSTTTSFPTGTNDFQAAVDMTGHAGCILDVTLSGGSTTDTILIDRFNFVAQPGQILLPTATPTIGGACAGPNRIVGSSAASGIISCINGAIVAGPGGGGGGGGITALTQDVTASGTGSVVATVRAFGNGTPLSSFQGLVQNNFGVDAQATQFDLSGFGKVAQRYLSGVNVVTFSSTPVFDLSLGDTQIITLTGNVSSSTVTNLPPVGYKQHVEFLVCQDGTGGRTFSYPTSFAGITPTTAVANGCTSEFFNVTTTASGTTITADNINGANCISASSPAACGQAAVGEVAIPVGTNPTLQINTSAWQAHSQLVFNPDQTKASDLGITCNTAGPAGHYEVTNGVVGTDVVLTWYGTIATNALCGTFTVRNP